MRSSLLRALISVAAMALIPVGASGEEGSDRERAEELFQQGIVQFEAGSYQQAAESFQASYDLNPVPSVLFNLGVTQRLLERYADAIRSFEAFIEEYDGNPARRERVRMDLEELYNQVGTVRITIEHPDPEAPVEGVEVRIDGELIPPESWERVLLTPGPHQVLIEAPDHHSYTRGHEIVAGEINEITFEIRPIEPDPPPGGRDDEQPSVLGAWWFWTVVGAVVVGAGLGVGLGVGLNQGENLGYGDIEVTLP